MDKTARSKEKTEQGSPATLMADKPAVSAAGFTLIEVLVALVILSSGFLR